MIAAIRDMTERRRIERDLRRINEQLRRDMNSAARIQRSLLPNRSADIPGTAVEWLYEPSDHLGGDSFNVFDAADGVVGFYILDVTGHGLVTALQSVALTRILASTWPQPNKPMPAKLAERLNAEFPVDVDAWQFFTFLGGVLDLSAGTLRYVSAGHQGPIHVPAGGVPVALEAAGLPIGMFPDASYDEFTAHLGPGDRLYVYSDGVTEVMNEADDDFGVARLVAVLAETRGRPLAETLRSVRRAADQWRGRRTARRRFHAGGVGGPGVMSTHCRTLDRRTFLSLAGVALNAAPFLALSCRRASSLRPSDAAGAGSGYGPLAADRRRNHGSPAAASAPRLPLPVVRLDRRPARGRTADSGLARRHGRVPGGWRPDTPRAQPRDPDRRTVRRPPAVRRARRRRHDDAGVRYGDRLGRRRVGESGRHRGQLRGRADTVGIVAHMRGDRAGTGWRERLRTPARVHLRGSGRRRGHRRAFPRDGTFRPRSDSRSIRTPASCTRPKIR